MLRLTHRKQQNIITSPGCLYAIEYYHFMIFVVVDASVI